MPRPKRRHALFNLTCNLQRLSRNTVEPISAPAPIKKVKKPIEKEVSTEVSKEILSDDADDYEPPPLFASDAGVRNY
jgi:hypothetical protein